MYISILWASCNCCLQSCIHIGRLAWTEGDWQTSEASGNAVHRRIPRLYSTSVGGVISTAWCDGGTSLRTCFLYMRLGLMRSWFSSGWWTSSEPSNRSCWYSLSVCNNLSPTRGLRTSRRVGFGGRTDAGMEAFSTVVLWTSTHTTDPHSQHYNNNPSPSQHNCPSPSLLVSAMYNQLQLQDVTSDIQK